MAAEQADAKLAETKRQVADAGGPTSVRAWDKVDTLLAEVERQESVWQRVQTTLALFRADGT